VNAGFGGTQQPSTGPIQGRWQLPARGRGRSLASRWGRGAGHDLLSVSENPLQNQAARGEQYLGYTIQAMFGKLRLTSIIRLLSATRVKTGSVKRLLAAVRQVKARLLREVDMLRASEKLQKLGQVWIPLFALALLEDTSVFVVMDVDLRKGFFAQRGICGQLLGFFLSSPCNFFPLPLVLDGHCLKLWLGFIFGYFVYRIRLHVSAGS
jgi:hypothetical protein